MLSAKMVPVVYGAANLPAVIIPHPSKHLFRSVPHDDTAQWLDQKKIMEHLPSTGGFLHVFTPSIGVSA